MIPRKGEKMIRFIKTIFIIIGLLIIGLIAEKAIAYKLESSKSSAVSKTSDVTSAVRNRQLECLAKNIYHEAGNQPFEGKVAVAQVTINRSESGQFPSDICQVIYQKNIIYKKVICQFSWYCENPSKLRPKNQDVYRESELVARQVLLEGFRLPGLKEALYYHADYVNPKWGREKIAKIGAHIFYK